jgi:hypothetical protein
MGEVRALASQALGKTRGRESLKRIGTIWNWSQAACQGEGRGFSLKFSFQTEAVAPVSSGWLRWKPGRAHQEPGVLTGSG